MLPIYNIVTYTDNWCLASHVKPITASAKKKVCFQLSGEISMLPISTGCESKLWEVRGDLHIRESNDKCTRGVPHVAEQLLLLKKKHSLEWSQTRCTVGTCQAAGWGHPLQVAHHFELGICPLHITGPKSWSNLPNDIVGTVNHVSEGSSGEPPCGQLDGGAGQHGPMTHSPHSFTKCKSVHTKPSTHSIPK